jgi:hypothetical protein
MTDVWFDSVAQEIKTAIEGRDATSLKFVIGIRLNGAPHIGTYLTLASTYIFASEAKKYFDLPTTVHIHFLDNDPAVAQKTSEHPATHFHCIFQTITSNEESEFLRTNYFSYLDELSLLTGCNYNWEIYSTAQNGPEFRSTVLQSLQQWNDFKYYVSGPPFVSAATGVRGIGSPCPQCGLFDGWERPNIELLSHDEAVIKSQCCNHGEYTTVLTNFNDTFLNLETTFRNVIKEVIAANDKECLSIMIKGLDWREGLQNLDTVLGILKIPKNEIPPRFLVPVIKTASGVKLSKSGILKSPVEFEKIHPALLDMSILKTEIDEYPSKLLSIAEELNSDPKFSSLVVIPSDIMEMLRLSD